RYRAGRAFFSSFRPRDGMEEGAADMAAPPAGGPKRIALTIGEFGKRVVTARSDDPRIVEFMAANGVAGASERAIRQKTRLPVAEVHLAFCEAGGMAEQAEHLVGDAVGIFQSLSQNHVAAALAMHRLLRREGRHPVAEISRGSQRSGMQFGIAAGQPAAIAIWCRSLVGQRREGHDFRARVAP